MTKKNMIKVKINSYNDSREFSYEFSMRSFDKEVSFLVFDFAL